MTIKPTNAVTPVKQNLYPKSAYDKLNKKKKRRALYGGRYVEYLSERLGDPDLSNSYEHVMDALIEFDEYLYYYAMEAKRSDEKKALSKNYNMPTM
jgi:hypothetical protein